MCPILASGGDTPIVTLTSVSAAAAAAAEAFYSHRRRKALESRLALLQAGRPQSDKDQHFMRDTGD